MLFVDIETYSELDIKTAAVDRYASHPSTRILMCAYAEDAGPVSIWEDNEPLPERLQKALYTPNGEEIVAWNKGFEHTVLKKVAGVPSGVNWRDAMVYARYVGLPGGLKNANKVPFFAGQAVTAKESLLINKFCKPQKDGTVKDRNTDPGDWALFVQYCKDDVSDTRLIWDWCFKHFTMPDRVLRAWQLDQLINWRGLPIDLDMCRAAATNAVRLQEDSHRTLISFTGLENPNSTKQLLAWVTERGYPYNGLGKELVQRFVDDVEQPDGEAKQALRLRLAGAKAAVKKFPKILETISSDNRLRQQFQFYGAHTGRWSGRGAQVQNLKVPRTPEDKAALAECVLALTNGREVKSLDALSFAGRPLIRAPKGKKVVISDFKSVENRVLAWLAGCDAMMDVYRKGQDPYKDFASKLWDLPYEEVSAEQRQIAKPGTLGCGFGLGGGKEIRAAKCSECGEKCTVAATISEPFACARIECCGRMIPGEIARTGLWRYAQMMGIDLTQEQATAQVMIFRDAFAEVCALWFYLEEGYKACVRTKREQLVGELRFVYRDPALRIVLPSGRELVYANPFAFEERDARGFKKVVLGFEGVKNNVWMRQTTYGGRLAENVVQSVAADLLWDSLFVAEADTALEVIGHCHDEIIVLADVSDNTAKARLEGYMTQVPAWATGLIMAADGAEGERYGKG